MGNDSYHHTDLKTELVEAGAKLLAEEGLKALSLRKIAAVCAVSHAAPYKHFKNKDELYLAIQEHIENRFTEKLQKSLDALPEATAWERLVGLGKGYVQFMVENPTYFRIKSCVELTELVPAGRSGLDRDIGGISLQVFLDTAVRYLDEKGVPAERHNEAVIAMWAMVDGLSGLLVTRHLNPQEDYLAMVERILCRHLTF